jgi:hypothetical protein
MGQRLVRHSPKKHHVAGTPIKASHMLAKNHAMHRKSLRQWNLESVTLDLAAYRADIGYRCFEIDGSNGEDYRWPSPSLFSPSLRIKV